MKRVCSAAAALLLAAPGARRHADRQRQRHLGRPRRQGHPLHRDDDRRRRAGSSQLLRPRRPTPPRADFRENGRGRTVIPGMIDAHAHVMGARPRRAAARPVGHALARRGAGADRRLCRRQSRAPVDRRPRLEPGALGPRPLPDRRRARRRRSPTARSGSSGSTATPAGPTAAALRDGRRHRRHRRPGRRPDRAHRRRPPARRRVRRRGDGAGRREGPAAARRATATSRSHEAQELLRPQRRHRGRRHGHQHRGLDDLSAARATTAGCASASWPMPRACPRCC